MEGNGNGNGSDRISKRAPVPPAGPKITGATDKTSLGVGRKHRKNGVFFANIPADVCDEEQLLGFFAQGFGPILAVVPTKPLTTQTESGSATAFFATSEDAEVAVRKNGIIIGGRRIYIRRACGFSSAPPGLRFQQRHSCIRPNICILCGANDHSEHSCPSIACSLCFQVGHLKEACPSRDASPKQSIMLCSACGGYGHAVEGCQRQQYITCMACWNSEHADCGPAMNIVLAAGAENGAPSPAPHRSSSSGGESGNPRKR